jgi:hypothetical protein
MNFYHSSTTAKGNSYSSEISQEDAEYRAKKLDDSGCTNCTNCTNCNGCINCSNCYDCTGCNDCINCYDCDSCCHCSCCNACDYCNNCTSCVNCNSCVDCSNCTVQPTQLIGLTWIVTIRSNNTIKIGCQDHSRPFWENASDSTIDKMNPVALTFWRKYKTLILSLPVPPNNLA